MAAFDIGKAYYQADQKDSTVGGNVTIMARENEQLSIVVPQNLAELVTKYIRVKRSQLATEGIEVVEGK